MKAVVFDLDDTLLRDDLSISDFTVRVFRRLHEAGFFVIAASGRAQLSMKPYVDQLGCVSVYISCNGAEIWDGRDHHSISRELFSAETAVQIARFGEKHRCYMQVYEGGCFYFNRDGIYARRYAASARLTGVCAGKLSAFIREPRNKILMIAREAKIASMYTEARGIFDGKASVTCSKPFYLEFNPVNATKGKALVTAADHLGILPEKIIAFGDSLNDLSMLQTAGKAVTVSNGWEQIRPWCDDVCESNNQDGPARYMNDHYLNGEVLF